MVDVYKLNIIPDILKHFKVKSVIITGLSDKKIIEEILRYDDAQITSIGYNNPHGFDIEIIEDNSLNVLLNLNNYDAIFINDDPNWFTVFNQLNYINNNNEEFPLVFICNNRFPHKRRDSYSNPNIIPDEFRHEFSKELPLKFNGKDILIQDDFYHATVEDTNKNGVLTAIEDFLKCHAEISIMDLQLTDEITILYPKSTISKIRIDKIKKDIENKKINDINLSTERMENRMLLSYISNNNLSIDNLEKLNNIKIEISQQNEMINDFENKIKIYDNEIEYKNSRIGGVESQLDLKDSQIKNLESKLINKDVLIQNLNNQINNLENDLNEKKISHEKSEVLLQNKINDKINIIENVSNDYEYKIKDLIRNNEDTTKELVYTSNKLKSTQRELNENKKSINCLKKEKNQLYGKLESRKYCISCFKEELSNNKLEIQYRKHNVFIKWIFSPLSYLILLFKSNSGEFFLNFKLYKVLKDSNCFDVGYYLKNNEDIIQSSWYKYLSPELHYVCNGFNENRKFNKRYFNRNSKKALLDYLSKCEEQ